MNEFLIGTQGQTVVTIGRPIPQRLTLQQAISLAAWLTVIADPTGLNVKAEIEEILS